jgi:hypothetical protein
VKEKARETASISVPLDHVRTAWSPALRQFHVVPTPLLPPPGIMFWQTLGGAQWHTAQQIACASCSSFAVLVIEQSSFTNTIDDQGYSKCTSTHEVRNEIVEVLIPHRVSKNCAKLDTPPPRGSRNRGMEGEKSRR